MLSGWSTVTDSKGSFLTTEQFSISPDGNTIIVADARTDSFGGVYMYQDYTSPGTWSIVAQYNYSSSGLTGLSVNWSNPADPVIYAVTTNANSGYAQNSIVEFSSAITGNQSAGNGGTIDGATSGGSAPTVIATAAANESFRGIALAPVAAAATPATTTTLTATGGNYASGGGLGGGPSLVAKVTGGNGSPTGYVSFQNNGVEIGSAPVLYNSLMGTYTATLTPSSNFLAGTYTSSLTAVYTGDANNAPSTSSTAQSATVTQYPTTEAVTDSGDGNANTAAPDTLIDTLTVPAGTDPTGTVQFYDGSTAIGSPVAVTQVISGGVISFSASLSYQFTVAEVGTDDIYAVYSGDSNFAGISLANSPDDAIVVINATTSAVTVSTSGTGTGTMYSFTDTVTGNSAAGVPSGSVQFYINGVAVGSSINVTQVTGSNDSASATLTPQSWSYTEGSALGGVLTPGVDSVTAVFARIRRRPMPRAQVR